MLFNADSYNQNFYYRFSNIVPDPVFISSILILEISGQNVLQIPFRNRRIYHHYDLVSHNIRMHYQTGCEKHNIPLLCHSWANISGRGDVLPLREGVLEEKIKE